MYPMSSVNAGPFWGNGPSPGAFYNFPGSSASAGGAVSARTETPGEFGTQRS